MLTFLLKFAFSSGERKLLKYSMTVKLIIHTHTYICMYIYIYKIHSYMQGNFFEKSNNFVFRIFCIHINS